MEHHIVPQEVLDAFTAYTPGLPAHSAGKMKVEKIGDGLINRSYKVTSELKQPFFLQKINTKVFPDVQALQDNYIHIWQYAEFEFTGIRIPHPVYIDSRNTLFQSADSKYWRAFELIENSKTIRVVQKPSQAKAVAASFAKFTAAFSDMNTGLLKETIPGFHDLSLRYTQFEEALETELYERMAQTKELVHELKQRERYKHFYELITASDEFPLRVMHHDAKTSNVLFHKKTGRVICLVDFDTVMPGSFFSDLGDMIRSMAGSYDENHRQIKDLHIRKEYYEAIIDGYLTVLRKELTPSEINYIHSAGLLMIYMQALRFTTDYLNGDLYYATTYPGQNLDRARNQFSLLQKLEEFLVQEYNFRV